jgi:ubiquinone/menaquinone biosynthesis C-methylase UbiE
MEKDPTKRFSDRVGMYVKYRPHYPQAVLYCLQDECGLTETAVIADVGSGTGILTKLFLDNGNQVYGVEPNDEMREAAETYLAEYAYFSSVNSRSEATTLPTNSVDFITAGQAFHWFQWRETKKEFDRILKPNGVVALVWNERRFGDDSFESAYDAFLRELVPEYEKVAHRSRQDALDLFFNGRYQLRTFPNQQLMNFESLKGRFLSSSYAPLPGDPRHEAAVELLQTLFDTYAENGRVAFHYKTRLFYDFFS